jgi:hypothetical protein
MKNEKAIYTIAIVVAIVVNVFSWHLPFFWDTILTSTITQYFYENGFHNFITPTVYDAGHPPLFYIYVTSFYYLFGKSLFAAHLSMLPFIIIGVISFIKILQHFNFNIKYQLVGILLFFSIPAVITQNTLVSYDAVLLSLYLAALYAILTNKKILFAFVLLGIVGISLRGIFCIVSLSTTIYFLEKRNILSWFKWNKYIAPAVIIISIWLYYHHAETGWWLSTNAANWSEQRGLVSLFGLFKNGISIARCLFDLGIAILTLLSLFYLIQNKKIDEITLLWLIPLIIFSISFLPFTNPINHRYFLIVYVLMLLPVLRFLSNRKIVYTILTIAILNLGHFLIYPVPISNGWDCTLVHTTFTNELKSTFYESMTKRLSVDISNVGTVFPMSASRKQTEFLDDTTKMINVNGKSIDHIEFVLFSNFGNDFSDEQINELRKWFICIDYRKHQVEMILYRNPKFHSK